MDDNNKACEYCYIPYYTIMLKKKWEYQAIAAMCIKCGSSLDPGKAQAIYEDDQAIRWGLKKKRTKQESSAKTNAP